MSYFKAKMRQIRFPLRLRPRRRWGSLQRSPETPVFKGPTYKGRRGRGGEAWMGREEGGKGRGEEKRGREGNRTTQNLVATPLCKCVYDKNTWFRFVWKWKCQNRQADYARDCRMRIRRGDINRSKPTCVLLRNTESQASTVNRSDWLALVFIVRVRTFSRFLNCLYGLYGMFSKVVWLITIN